MPNAMYHLNNNALCAIDIETTGPTVGEHSIWQITILPLNNFYKPIVTPLPFDTVMKPHSIEFDEKYITRENMTRCLLRGLDPYKMSDVFERWCEQKLNLRQGKKIMVLAYDWASKKPFLENWLHPELFKLYFHEWYRDLLPVSLHINDSAEHNIEQMPYPKSFFTFLCTRLGIEFRNTSQTLSHCIALAEAYKRMLRNLFGSVKVCQVLETSDDPFQVGPSLARYNPPCITSESPESLSSDTK